MIKLKKESYISEEMSVDTLYTKKLLLGQSVIRQLSLHQHTIDYVVGWLAG